MMQGKVRRCVKLASHFVLKHIRCFNGQNCLFKLSETLELLIIRSELLIIYEFLRNDTPTSHVEIFSIKFKENIYIKEIKNIC